MAHTDDNIKREKRKEFGTADNIGKLQQRMYSRERRGFLPWRRRRPQPTPQPLVDDTWHYDLNESEESDKAQVSQLSSGKSMSKIVKILFGLTFVFFTVSILGAGAYMYISSSGATTDSSVRVTVEGITSISAGSVLELQLLVINDNDEPVEFSDLIIKYPDGTVSPVNFKSPMPTQRIPMGRIEPNSARRGALRAVIFGSEGDTLSIEIELQYRARGSSALRSSTVIHNINILNDALSVSIDGDAEFVPGQDTPVAISVKSYADTILSGVYLDALLPFGVSITNSSPEYLEIADREFRWNLGSIRPGEERVVHVSLTADGQEGDTRQIQFLSGVGLVQETEGVYTDENATVLTQERHIIEISRPFMTTKLRLNGLSLGDMSVRSEQNMNIQLQWKNNLTETLNDVEITVKIDGPAFNRAGVETDLYGFYRSMDNSILWNTKTAGNRLKVVAPGDTGDFSFKIKPLPKNQIQQLKEPNITFDIDVVAKRPNESNVPETLVSGSSHIIKVITDLIFDSYVLFDSSPFSPVGTLPPKADYETQYTVVWEVANTTSDVSNATVVAKLPDYIRWVGLTTPATEQVVYNKSTDTIEWNLGQVPAGNGRESRKVSFVIGLTPSLSQVGTTPLLLFNQELSAIDVYTNKVLVVDGDEITTKLIREPNFNNDHSYVVK